MIEMRKIIFIVVTLFILFVNCGSVSDIFSPELRQRVPADWLNQKRWETYNTYYNIDMNIKHDGTGTIVIDRPYPGPDLNGRITASDVNDNNIQLSMKLFTIDRINNKIYSVDRNLELKYIPDKRYRTFWTDLPIFFEDTTCKILVRTKFKCVTFEKSEEQPVK